MEKVGKSYALNASGGLQLDPKSNPTLDASFSPVHKSSFCYQTGLSLSLERVLRWLQVALPKPSIARGIDISKSGVWPLQPRQEIFEHPC